MLRAMMGRFLAAFVLAWAAMSPLALAQTAASRAEPVRATSVVVELYTSQGCRYCLRANRLLGALAREEGIIALTMPVGYWDYLGWTDTFARDEFSDRQRAYARTLRGPRATPQLVIDGVSQLSANDWDDARAALQQVQRTRRPAGAPVVTIQRLPNNRVRAIVGQGSAAPADVWFFAFDPGPISVEVTSGENANRTVWHYNLVRWARRMGSWTGAAAFFESGSCTPECTIIVQPPGGRPVVAAASTQAAPR